MDYSGNKTRLTADGVCWMKQEVIQFDRGEECRKLASL